jgi:hypothetical protein
MGLGDLSQNALQIAKYREFLFGTTTCNYRVLRVLKPLTAATIVTFFPPARVSTSGGLEIEHDMRPM